MPCTSLACDFESLPMTWPSLGRWISISKSSSVTQSRKLRYSRSVFSTMAVRQDRFSRKKRASRESHLVWHDPIRRATGPSGAESGGLRYRGFLSLWPAAFLRLERGQGSVCSASLLSVPLRG